MAGGNLPDSRQRSGVNNNSFAMAVGGGFDIRLSKHFSFRPFQMDYLFTDFKDNLVTWREQSPEQLAIHCRH